MIKTAMKNKIKNKLGSKEIETLKSARYQERN